MSYSYNEIKPRDYVLYENQPHEVLSVHVARKQQGKPTNQTNLKNLITGKQYNVTFYPRDTIPAAEIENKKVVYIYQSGDEIWFHSEGDPSDRFPVMRDTAGNVTNFIREKEIVTAVTFDNEVIGFRLPIKVELTVETAPPNIKGDTSSGGNKQVELETGYSVTTPLFINAGDLIRVNTDTGEYVERAEKA